MPTIQTIFGHGEHLDILQMTSRAIVIFFVTLILIRFTGMRMNGIKSAFDICVTIMLGAILSRAIVGASPFIPTIIAAFSFVAIHRIIAFASVNNKWMSHLVKGVPHSLYKDGRLNEANLKKCLLSFGDLMEEVRLNMHQNNLDEIEEIFMERSGKISVIKKS